MEYEKIMLKNVVEVLKMDQKAYICIHDFFNFPGVTPPEPLYLERGTPSQTPPHNGNGPSHAA